MRNLLVTDRDRVPDTPDAPHSVYARGESRGVKREALGLPGSDGAREGQGVTGVVWAARYAVSRRRGRTCGARGGRGPVELVSRPTNERI